MNNQNLKLKQYNLQQYTQLLKYKFNKICAGFACI